MSQCPNHRVLVSEFSVRLFVNSVNTGYGLAATRRSHEHNPDNKVTVPRRLKSTAEKVSVQNRRDIRNILRIHSRIGSDPGVAQFIARHEDERSLCQVSHSCLLEGDCSSVTLASFDIIWRSLIGDIDPGNEYKFALNFRSSK